jgi:hypothetical protein
LWGAVLVFLAAVPVHSDIHILPESFTLHGSHADQRLIVERSDQGDWAGQVAETMVFRSTDESVVKIEGDRAVPVANGKAQIVVDHDGQQASALVEVTQLDAPLSWEFRRHVLPVLSRSGCNSGACHGALAGKGGFKLSLRGYNPPADYYSITRAARGRRIELADPGSSLLLAKPTAALPHKGGVRFEVGSPAYRILSEWIQNGAPGPSDDDARLASIDVLPREVRLGPADRQQLLVTATYSDGRRADVTNWAKFTSSNESVLKVDEQGTVEVVGHGEGAVVVWFSSRIVLSRVTVPYPNGIDGQSLAAAQRNNFIDDLVLEKLRQLRLAPSPMASDAEFIRRVYLDTIGTLPTAEEVRTFLDDVRTDKRNRLIDHLLGRSEFVDYWTFKWSDMLLINGKRLRPAAVKSYYQWLRSHLERNTPWDQFVREIVTARGGSIENGAANFYALHQDPETMSENVCQAFLGLSIGCAKCHNHPLEKWTNDQYYAMANLFARVKAKGWGGDGRNGDGARTLFVATEGELVQPSTGRPQPPTPLDGVPLDFDSPVDRREHLANWLTSPENPYFARAIVNRVWANFLGTGIVEPVDDMRLSNPASNDQLLDELSTYLVDHRYDLKQLMKLILQSATYQRSSLSIPENESDRRYYSRYYARRLSAEVLLDAIAQVTGVPSKFTQIGYDGNDFQETKEYPLGTRAIQLYDSAVVSNFLTTFGRNERDITCECERSNTPSMVQVLHIHNGQTINERLRDSKSCVSHALASGPLDFQTIIERAYLSSLSRFPTDTERQQLLELLTAVDTDQTAESVEDLYWSILSSREFLFNH